MKLASTLHLVSRLPVLLLLQLLLPDAAALAFGLERGSRGSRQQQSSRHPTAVAAAPPVATLGQLNARDYGAVGDDHADDAPALQRAIDAALESGQTLVLPAGRYRVNSSLNVMSSARAGFAKPGLGFAKHPLRLIGEGHDQAAIIAAVPMHTVLNFSCANNPNPSLGPAAPISTENQYIADVEIDAAGLANYSIFAPGMSRSRFVRVAVSGARNVGMSIGESRNAPDHNAVASAFLAVSPHRWVFMFLSPGYGWCNYIEGCRFGGNGVGLHTYASANNIDVIDSIFEGNVGVGIYVSGGAQLLFSGNVMEGNGGPGIIVFGAMGVEISSNYFEANCEPCAAGRWCDDRFKKIYPALDNRTAPVIDLNTDIVLTGGASFHDGNSDYKHWGPIRFTYGQAYPPQSVLISGNTHAPSANGSAILAICGSGIVLEANEFGSRTASAASTNVALVETCSDSSLCGVTNLFLKANTGFTAVVPTDPATLLNRGQVRLRPTSKQYTGGVQAHTWAFEDPAPLYRPRNLLAGIVPSGWSASGGCSVTKAENSKQFNGAQVWSVRHVTKQCELTMFSLDLATMPEASGQQLYLAVQLNVTLPDTGVALLIDPGNGGYVSNSNSYGYYGRGWQLDSFQLPLHSVGTARFGLQVFTSNPLAKDAVAVEVAATVVAPIGHEWTRL